MLNNSPSLISTAYFLSPALPSWYYKSLKREFRSRIQLTTLSPLKSLTSSLPYSDASITSEKAKLIVISLGSSLRRSSASKLRGLRTFMYIIMLVKVLEMESAKASLLLPLHL